MNTPLNMVTRVINLQLLTLTLFSKISVTSQESGVMTLDSCHAYSAVWSRINNFFFSRESTCVLYFKNSISGLYTQLNGA